MNNMLAQEVIENRILFIRGKKVMVDTHLARLYQIETKALNLAVKRNIERFPADFMFQLTKNEYTHLRFQFETSKQRGGRRYTPYVFTELGIAMLSSILNSRKAIQINMQIMRTFIKIREIMATHKELREKIEKMEKNYDSQFKIVFEAIRQLLETPEPSKKKYGFLAERSHQDDQTPRTR